MKIKNRHLLNRSVLLSTAIIMMGWSALGTTLTRDGQPQALLLLPDNASKWVTQAADELADTLEVMSGARLDRKTFAPGEADKAMAAARNEKLVPIVITGLPPQRLFGKGNAPIRGEFALQIESNAILIDGIDEGPYYAALELLEQLGCRWFMPGPLGTVIPQQKTVELAPGKTRQAPSFPSRHFQMPDRDWQAKVRCGGDVFAGSHGIAAPKAILNRETGELEPAENAEYYSLVNGKRTLQQHCVSNPKLVDYCIEHIKTMRKNGRGPVIGFGPNDGTGFCECENCRALDAGDFDPFSNETSVTDRYIWFYNQVLAGVLPEYPDTKLAFYIYHTYMRPPLREKPNHAIQGALAPISLDRVHGFSNPIAPEKSYARWLFKAWGELLPELYDRGYWSNLACPGFPFIIIDRLRDEIPACHAFGVKGWRVETFPNYGPQFPSMYVAGKLMWDHTLDVDALLEDVFEKFFGPAQKPMGEYIRRMDAALRDGDHTTGSSWDMPLFYPAAFRAEMRTLLAKGTKLAKGQDVYAARVAVIADSFELVDAFNDMMAARVNVDFVKAQAELTRLDAVAERLMGIKPVPMLSAGRHSTYINYMNRFFRLATEQGNKRVTDGNQLVAAANDEWSFQIDPLGVGEEIGLYRADVTGGNWQTMKTSSSSWSNQGLRYYKGMAWYRQDLEVPAKFKGKRIFFWCGGVDNAARVWINGKPIGNSHGATFYPFELDATEALQPGRNVVVVCVDNNRVSEVGTGGIMAPVMLYAPATGAKATLENVRELKPTFP